MRLALALLFAASVVACSSNSEEQGDVVSTNYAALDYVDIDDVSETSFYVHMPFDTTLPTRAQLGKQETKGPPYEDAKLLQDKTVDLPIDVRIRLESLVTPEFLAECEASFEGPLPCDGLDGTHFNRCVVKDRTPRLSYWRSARVEGSLGKIDLRRTNCRIAGPGSENRKFIAAVLAELRSLRAQVESGE